MRQPSLIELGFGIEKLRVSAFETVRALADHFEAEPQHVHGLRLLLHAGEFVQRTVIGPTEVDSRPYLARIASSLPEGCFEIDGFTDVAELAATLADLGWPVAMTEIWSDTDEDTFADSGRTVLALVFDRGLRVSISRPDHRPPVSAVVERGQYLACATGEQLHFTDAICRLPLDCDAADLDLTAIPGFDVTHLIATCDTCNTVWIVDPGGDFRDQTARAGSAVWDFFESAANLAYVSGTIACPDDACPGRVALSLE